MNPVIFREYDIRGVVDKDFDASFAKNLGQAWVTFVKRRNPNSTLRVAVGRDARLSSPKLAQAVVDGLKSAGAHVLDLGMVTTPISYFATFALPEMAGAMMITGSHNPPEYNGFKISVGQSTIYGESIQELRKIIEAKDFIASDAGKVESYNILDQYVERYRTEFANTPQVPLVLDCGNGTAGVIARRLFAAAGQNPTILFEEPDGRFPNHHPDPTVMENLEDLIREVKKQKAICGLGFDGDTDRIGIVDENGEVIFGDEYMAIISQDILQKQPGQKIIGDVKCSDRLFSFVEKKKGLPIMWKTGHSLVKQKIKEEKAPFGGELSGHIFFADRNYGYDDALYAGLRLVEIVAKTGKTLKQLLADFPKAFATPEIRIDTTEEKKHQIVARLKDTFSKDGSYKVNTIDGVRVSFADGWGLARASNTQPVIVMRFESSTEEGLKSIQKQFENLVQPLL
jgi:phosphomannomutase/phosphoglucomutase